MVGEEEERDPETLKTKPTCLTMALGWEWAEEPEEGKPMQVEEVDEGGEGDVQLSPLVQ